MIMFSILQRKFLLFLCLQISYRFFRQSEAISAKSLTIASTTPEAAKTNSSSSNASSSGSVAISKSDSVSHQKPPSSVRVVTSPLVTHLSTPSSSLPSSTLPASSRKASFDSVSRYARTPKVWFRNFNIKTDIFI